MQLNRRHFLASTGAAFAVSGAARADEADVVIIGAGAAGIGAARELKMRGHSYILIEAASRIGGRLHTDRSLGPAFDAGGAYIHFATRNPWTDFARDAGLSPDGTQSLWQGTRAYRHGTALSADEAEARRRAMRRVNDIYDDIDERNDVSFATALRREAPEVQIAGRLQARNAAGEEPHYISVADWQQLASGANLIVPGGYGALAEKTGADLGARLGMRATAVDWSGSGVTVKTDKGDIRARAAIITVSIGVLQANGIRFTPNLPQDVQRSISGLRMGALTKIGLHFEDTRFGLMPHQFLAEIGNPAEAMTFEAWPQNQNLIVGVTGGDHGRALTKAGEAAAADFALTALGGILGGDIRKAYMAGRLAGWSADPLYFGSYAVVLPGRSKAREVLSRPIANRLWLAGEASAGAYSMTAGGATLAGQKAAQDIMGLSPKLVR